MLSGLWYYVMYCMNLCHNKHKGKQLRTEFINNGKAILLFKMTVQKRYCYKCHVRQVYNFQYCNRRLQQCIQMKMIYFSSILLFLKVSNVHNQTLKNMSTEFSDYWLNSLRVKE